MELVRCQLVSRSNVELVRYLRLFWLKAIAERLPSGKAGTRTVV